MQFLQAIRRFVDMRAPHRLLIPLATAILCTPLIATSADRERTTGVSPPSNAAFEAWLKTPSQLPAVTPRVVRHTIAWADATPAIVYENGRRLRDPSIEPWRFSVTLRIDVARAEAVEQHFGVPMEALQFSYRSEAERDRLERLEQDKLAQHGLRVLPTSDAQVGQLEPDFQWLIDCSRADINPVAQSILKETDRVLRERGDARPVTTRDRVEAVFRFIQAIPYETIPESPDGKDRCGLRTPLLTLLRGGDCDSKSVLMASLLRAACLAECAVVTLQMKDGTGHAILGIRVPVQQGDRTIQHEGRTYVLAEAASIDASSHGDIAPLGVIGKDWSDFLKRPYKVVPVR
jgi:transglutaminase-like putative cysteine protease